MNPKLMSVGIVGIIIIAAAVVVFGTDVTSPYWETETVFGAWGEEIIIEYEDGSTESLKLLQMKSEPLKLLYGGKSVNTINYRLTAMADGEGYDEACIKVTNLVFELKIYKGTTTKWTNVITRGTSTHGIPIDGQFHSLSAKAGDNFADLFKTKNWADGTYTIKFTPGSSGDPIYWGEPGQSESDPEGTCSLPSGKTITVAWSKDQWLTVVLGGKIET